MQKSSCVLEIEILILSPLPYKRLHINYEDLKTSDNKAWASLVAQLIKNLPPMQGTLVQFLGQEDPLEKYTHSSILGFPGGSAGKESTRNADDLGWEDSLKGGYGYLLQYSCLENPHG